MFCSCHLARAAPVVFGVLSCGIWIVLCLSYFAAASANMAVSLGCFLCLGFGDFEVRGGKEDISRHHLQM